MSNLRRRDYCLIIWVWNFLPQIFPSVFVCVIVVCGPYVAETHTCGLFLWCWWSFDIHSKVEFYDISSMIKHAKKSLWHARHGPPFL